MTTTRTDVMQPDPEQGAADEAVLRQRVVDSPVGRLLLVAGPLGLRAILWPDEDGSRVRRAFTPVAPAGDRGPRVDPEELLDRTEAQLAEYFVGSRTSFDLELDPRGTAYQLRAWAALREIPYGQTRSYGQQALTMGETTGARAMGAANARNPLSIVVPCHRVVGASGGLTGFAGGVATKAWLLEHERSVLAHRVV